MAKRSEMEVGRVGVEKPRKPELPKGGLPLWRRLKDQRATPDDILAKFEIDTPAVDVRTIAQQLGIRIHNVIDPGWSGAVKSDEMRADIWVNEAEALVRQRFTIAHELGHLMLDPLGIEHRDDTFSGSQKEVAANRFAANLLMPLWMLSQHAEHFRGSPTLLAGRFEVSPQAMAIRLGLL